MRPAFRCALIAAVCSFAPQFAAAQDSPPVTVNGLALDSLHRQPLRGALLTLEKTNKTALSDELGRFHFDSVAPGTYAVLMQHDALDSLGYPYVRSQLTVRDGRDTVRVAVPSFRAFWTRYCGGGAAPKDSGLVFGSVRDAKTGEAVKGAMVHTGWLILGFDKKAGVSQKQVGGFVTADANGGYVVCGVPNNTMLQFLTTVDASATDAIETLADSSGVTRRDFLIGVGTDSTERGVVTGVVSAGGGQLVANARVRIEGLPEVVTGENGRFTLRDVPTGTRMLEVMSIGSERSAAAVNVPAHDTVHVAMKLQKLTVLAPVKIAERNVRERWVQDLEKRKSQGIAKFVDSTVIQQRGTIVGALLETASVRVNKSGGIQLGTCTNMVVWIDRRELQQDEVKNELRMAAVTELGMVEVYSHVTGIPEEFWSRRAKAGPPGCALVLWTKRMFP